MFGQNSPVSENSTFLDILLRVALTDKVKVTKVFFIF